ncbi:hypothetical protein SynMITS9220_01750 [Synechococcus sp. MIT S9220]|uniref:hypothetical protein n=1 Tax=Synechococcus sp. MIT S9220 TaxID=166309 RepID=UPI00164A2714|nr:hypothetical protein [Synechococcus sp. MIT S9220]QNJ23043.1 hypothetical protein SynMITS9220_01750 [Synechococcus sp. MIT S9220]
MKLCDDKLGEALDQIRDERKLWNSDRARYQKLEKEDFDKYLDEYYDTFKWTFLLDEEYEKINIIRGYCDPSPNKKFKDMWSVAAYVEYLSRPLDGSEESEVDRVYISGSSYSWDEPFRK